MRISVSSVSRFEPCEFPSRVDRLPLSLSSLCFCLSSLSVPAARLFAFCPSLHLHVAKRSAACFSEGHVKTPEFPPLRSLPVFHRRRLSAAALLLFHYFCTPSRRCLRAGRCATRRRRPPPPAFSFSDSSCKTFQALSGSFMCVYVPRDSGALMG